MSKYKSKYTGSEIDTAIDAFLGLNVFNVKLEPDENGYYRLDINQKYRIQQSNQYDPGITALIQQGNGSPETVSLYWNAYTQQYGERFTIRLLDVVISDTKLEYGGYPVYIVAEVNGKIEQIITNLDTYDKDAFVLYYATAIGATEVWRAGEDVTIKALSGDNVFIRYSEHPDGTDFTDSWSQGKKYLGVYLGLEASTDKDDYDWMRIAGDNGAGIEKIEKTGTSGLVDTYTIYLTDKQTYTFTVTNGREGTGTGGAGIEKIEKTSTIGLVDTYTITLTDGKTFNFTVTNGREGTGTGGGSTSSGVDFKVTNKSGWLVKNISKGAECSIDLNWYSIYDGIPTGDGTLKVAVNGGVKTVQQITQGDVSVPIGNLLVAGRNEVTLTVTDIYGNAQPIIYTVTMVAASISSYFDATVAYTGSIDFTYNAVGELEKTVHFLIDGDEKYTDSVLTSNREKTYTIPAQSHGSHTLEVYYTGVVDGGDVESNHLYYDIICYEAGKTSPIIATPFNATSVQQYSSVIIPFSVYTPNSLTSMVQLKDGNTTVSERTVDRTQQTWVYRVLDYGTENLSIVCGNTVKPISFEVTETKIDVSAETNKLELCLTSEGRSNDDTKQSPNEWKYGNIEAELTNFNFKSDGWLSDNDGNTVLRVSGDARVTIPFNIFGSDFRTTGKTVEIELATRDVLNYDAVILSSWSGERGIKITAQQAILKSEQSEIFTPYKENEHIRVAFCVEKQAENRLLGIYINGIMSGVVQYPDGDDFSQTTPVGISIGSNECTTDIYCIRVYGSNLSRYQIVDNWIADTQDVGLMVDRYTRNDIFDSYGNISINKLPADVPYIVVNATKYEDLPSGELDEFVMSGFYTDPLHPERSFTFTNAIMKIQGTSSLTYPRKNYKFLFNNGFVVNGIQQEAYQLRPTSMPTNIFTFKADQASSEGANNVELAMFYDDTCPVKTPPQLEDARVRQGIEGYPCLMFYYDGTNYNFIGKYNFNNDKETEEVFGLEPGDECWEIRLNNTNMVIWKDDNFEGTEWEASFKARYPSKYKNVTNLKALASWLKSTDTTVVSTDAEKAQRLAKFKNEFEDWFNKDAMIFNYIFTETFLMMDNRAKNAFPTRFDEDGKWLILPYDYDSAIGINNMGELKYGYHLEDTDIVDGHVVFNGQESVLFVNIRLAFADEIMKMYQTLRSEGLFSYPEIEKRFEDHQKVWGEAIFNEDARFKYIDPLVNDGSSAYLPMLQGSKAEQRKWWLYNRFRYLDSKYNAGDSLLDFIKIRPYAVADITVTPYADIYASAKFDSILVRERALRAKDEDGNAVSYTLKNPLSTGKEADVLIYSASQLLDIGDLSGLKAEWADFSMGTKLKTLKIGSGDAGYENPNLTNLTIGNLTLLSELDVRNCSALTQSVDLSGCTNIERAYFEGTAIAGVKLPNGGILKALHLPGTVSALTIQNQPKLRDFVMPSYENISTLRLEGVDQSVFDVREIINQIQENARVRILGIDLTFNRSEEILAFYDKLDTFRGLDENGNNLDYPVVSGTIHVARLGSDELLQMMKRYPNIVIDYMYITNTVKFISDGVVISSQKLMKGESIAIPESPAKDSTVQYEYIWRGWSLDGVNVTSIPATMGDNNLTFIAVYTQKLRYYTVRFLNGETVLQESLVAYGEIPVYTRAEPTPPDNYLFDGWSPEIGKVTGDVDYVAQFISMVGVRALIAKTINGNYTNNLVQQYKSSDAQFGGGGLISGCANLTDIDLPNCKFIAAKGFANSYNLKTVRITAVEHIGNEAFWGCMNLESVYLPAIPPTIHINTFTNTGVFVFYIPSGSLSAYEADTQWASVLSKRQYVEEDR